jgi:hypothetical protein
VSIRLTPALSLLGLTIHNRRFHIHTLNVENGKAGAVTRLTEDHDGGLPRDYYNRYDHYLSPTGSPGARPRP